MFIRGKFTNVFLLLGVGIFTVIASVVAFFKKEYKLILLDFVICLVCFVIFNILMNL